MIRTRCTWLATLDLDISMDFHEKKAKKALWTKEKAGAELRLKWVLDHKLEEEKKEAAYAQENVDDDEED